MNLRRVVRGAGYPGTVVLVLGLVAAVAFGLGRGSVLIGAAQAQAPVTGYDIGVAGKPTPTGQVRTYELVAGETSWEIAPGVVVPAIAYNRQVPGPTIRVMEGDTIRVTLKNELSKSTSIHWHGLHVPNAVDGVPGVTQAPIAPGQSYTYEFPASHAGTFMYHPHDNSVEQIDRGLYAPLIIDPATPTATRFDREYTMMLSAWDTNTLLGGAQAMPGMSMAYNYFTINGKAFPSNEPWTVREGDLVRVRLINISNLAHPMHLHGGDFTVIAKDGEPIRAELQQTMNTLSVDAGETYDIAFRADNPGHLALPLSRAASRREQRRRARRTDPGDPIRGVGSASQRSPRPAANHAGQHARHAPLVQSMLESWSAPIAGLRRPWRSERCSASW